MSDGARVYPVNKVVLHHAVSDPMKDWEDLDVQDWFNNIGRNRGYEGVEHSYHIHPTRGTETFSQAHFCLHPYTKDNNPYGWKLTTLIKDPANNVAWHAGNWAINQQSYGIETAGNWLNLELPVEACMCVADFFRPFDKQLNGGLNFYFHSQFSATACPGRVKERINLIVDMVNNPDKYKKQVEQKMTQAEQDQLNALSKKVGTQDQTIISLTDLRNQDIATMAQQQKMLDEQKTTIDDLTLKLNQAVSALADLTTKYESEVKLRQEKEVEISGLNEAMAKMHADTSTVLIPNENAFTKLEKIIEGKFTLKEKMKMIGQDFLYAFQNALGGATFTFGGVEVFDKAFGVIGANYPVWVKAIVIVAIFAIGYNGTKSISKNLLTQNNYTIAKGVVGNVDPRLKDQADTLEYALTNEGLLPKQQ